jgi:hypothetical protein
MRLLFDELDLYLYSITFQNLFYLSNSSETCTLISYLQSIKMSST